ncbi:MmpS family transport accessory protein [Nocardia sp. NPDC005366]|uniref:MmpS family transport accessory protein n=1 Tax=Nocardia sp. NPDC005366 TaxID=3156878 RepID=UPI0033A3F6E8
MENRKPPHPLGQAGDPPREPLSRGVVIAAVMVPIVLVIAAFGIYLAVSGGADDEVTFVYEVTGVGATADISYNLGPSGLSRVEDAPLPWQKSVTGSAQWASISVSSGTGGGTITCRLLLDGKVVDQETAVGFASCSYAD